MTDPRALTLPLAAHGLAGSMFDMPDGPFAPDEWFELVRNCRTNGLIGMLAAAVQRGDMRLTPPQAEELAVLENETAGIALLVEQRAARLAALLGAADVGHRLLGGPARGRLGYRRPGIRTFDNALMLVEPKGMEVAPPPRGVVMTTTLIPPEGRPITLRDLADPPTLLALAEQPVPTVSVEEHLVLACLDVAGSWARDLADPRGILDLVAQRDVAELALFPAIDPARVQQTAESWGVVDLVARAVVEVWHLFELADRTRLSVWAYRMTDLPVGGRTAASRSNPAIHPERRPAAAPASATGRLGRMVHKLAPGRHGG
ncbi:MAG TPA: hypothetical protein VGJ86_26015 [Acidimicrobiales bacterium]